MPLSLVSAVVMDGRVCSMQAAPDYTNRWAMVAPAFLTHMCIGSPWAWSVMSGTLTREMGVVASAASDW